MSLSSADGADPRDELRIFCERLAKLRHEAGGPTLNALAARDGMPGKSQISDILRGNIKSLPPWDVIQTLVRAYIDQAKRHRRVISVVIDIEAWRREYEYVTEWLLRRGRNADTVSGQTEVPQELPGAIPSFVGRHEELQVLDGLVEPALPKPSTIVISAVSGTAGVGKTALAVHWAHRSARHFPDGCLYVDLRGYDPDEPMSAGDALARFLRALGDEDKDIPYDVDERAGRYRTLVARRRLLVVLDNARSTDQVRLLLPGSATCVTLVTSRDTLGGLVARFGAARIDLDVLSSEDAVDLLSTRIKDRVRYEHAAAVKLSELCAHLPLALAIAAEVAALRTEEALESLVQELADEHRILDLLDTGDDPRSAVRAVFSWSYKNLDRETARLFRFGSVHPGPDIGLGGLVALSSMDDQTALSHATRLVRASLWQLAGPRRYKTHDLLRIYAEECASADSGGDVEAARTALLDYYLHSALAAVDLVFPHESDRRPRLPGPSVNVVPRFHDSSTARRWLEEEQPSLIRLAGDTGRRGRGTYTIFLCDILRRYLEAGSHYVEALRIYGYGLDAARPEGDRAAEGRIQNAYGIVLFRQGRYLDALSRLSDAMAIFHDLQDLTSEGAVLSNLGNVHLRLGNPSRALANYERSLAIRVATKDKVGEGHTLNNIGFVHQRIDEPDKALEPLRRALGIFQELNDRVDASITLGNLGAVYGQLRMFDSGLEALRDALAICREDGDKSGEADTLKDLGIVYQRQGDHDKAVAHLLESLRISREIDDHVIEAEALGALGDLAKDRGDVQAAAQWWSEALDLYLELESPEAAQIQSRLESLGE